MSPRRMFRSKAGWTSAAVVLVAAGVLAGTMLADAAGPALPQRTPAQLLVAMRNAKPPTALTAVITENANLGFPSLPNIAGLQSSVFSAASLVTGTHTVDIWYGGPRHVRIAVPVSFGETDLRVNGNQVWLWNSHGQTATHFVLPATPERVQIPSARMRLFKLAHPRLVLPHCLAALRLVHRQVRQPAKAMRMRIVKCIHSLKIGPRISAFRPLTPQEATNKFLAAIGPTTKVTVTGSTVVAGRSAYQLVIAPRTDQSLIDRIVIAVDSKTYLPLQLAVFARGTSGPAFQIGFTSLTFGQPAASNFTFTPPAGAHVRTEKLAADLPGFLGPLSMGGIPAPLPGPFTSQRFLPHGPPSDWHGSTGVAKVSWNTRPIRMVLRAVGKAGPPKRVVAVQVAPDGNAAFAQISGQIVMPASPFGFVPGAPASGFRVLGSGWLSVAVIPAGNSLAGLSPSPAKHPIPGSAPAGGPHPLFAPPGSVQGPQIQALLRILLNSAARVHGSWGSGRLLRTSLFSVLVTNNGKVLIGAVTPDVLYADAAKVK
jgi:hypothetical protein